MGLRELLEKFVVFDEASTNYFRRPKEREEGVPSPTPSPDFDLSDVYRQRGISPVPFSAEQALALLDSLPKGIRPETRRQAFIDLLEGISTSPAAVKEDARGKVDALTAQADDASGEFAEFITNTEEEIAGLEKEIRDKQEALEHARAAEEQVTQQCRAEAERLKTLLQILG